MAIALRTDEMFPKVEQIGNGGTEPLFDLDQVAEFCQVNSAAGTDSMVRAGTNS